MEKGDLWVLEMLTPRKPMKSRRLPSEGEELANLPTCNPPGKHQLSSASPWGGSGKDPNDAGGNGEEQEARPGAAKEQNREGVGRKKGQRNRGVRGEVGQN